MPAAPAILKMFTDELDDHIQKWDVLCLELANALGMAQEFERIPSALQALFRCAHNLKAGSQIAELSEMAHFLHRLEDYLTQLKDGKLDFVEESLDLFNDSGAYLKTSFQDLSAGRLPSPAAIKLAEPLVKKIERLLVLPATGARIIKVAGSEATPEALRSSFAPLQQDITTKVKLSQLDHLIRLIGELTLESEAMGSQGRKILKDLQNTALGLRMQSLEGLFAKLEKSAGDTARRLGKKLAIRKEGLEVELDKQIIERLSEPLTHMIRNAIDHGLEPAAIRRFTGKSEVGLLRFSATDVGGIVELVIEDDGKGIDAERVFQKAIERKLVSETASLSDNEKRQLIFLPGFSTNETITEFSGRGVGMDVVKTLMDNLGGEIEIESEAGQGTRFILKIPTTVSVLNALVIQASGVSYAIPTQDLREVVNLAEHEIKYSSRNQAYFVLRDRAIVLRRISEFVRLGPDRVVGSERFTPGASDVPEQPALVVKAGDSVVAFPVDRIRSQERLHIRPLNESLRGLNGAIGTAILAGGEPSLILNLQSLVRKISLGA
jgi:two-component system chemotaxis sensor kinase CheA